MEKKQILAVDLGNSYVKIGCFINNELTEVKRVSWTDVLENDSLKKEIEKCEGIFSSVLSKEQNEDFKKRFPLLKQFDLEMNLPVSLHYNTPETVGKDRLCNAVGAWNQAGKNTNIVVVDVGTCIKLDVVTQDGVYEGGSISPGIRLRYQSLNDYTANLPLICETGKAELIGKSTKESMHSGVINGMQAEINGLIARYEQKYESLTIFVTGGDAKYFDLETKNNIFANKNLTLEGLYQIYVFNVQ